MAGDWKVSYKADPSQAPIVIDHPLAAGPRDRTFALPATFTAIGERGDGLRVEVDVEVERHRSRIRRIRIETESDRDLSSTTLREIPVRDLVVFAAGDALWEMEWDPESQSATLHQHVQKNGELSEEGLHAIARSIGYVAVPR